MKRYFYVWRIFCYGVLGILFVFIISYIFASARISKNDSGVCSKDDRILAPEENRRNFIDNLIKNSINNASIGKIYYGESFLKVGIIRNVSELDVASIMSRAQNNMKNFEENFAIEELAGRQSDDALSYSEPFVLVIYSKGEGAMANFIESSNILSVKTNEKLKDSLSLMERISGFGVMYYRVSDISIAVECCDIDKNLGSQDVKKIKKSRYLENLDSLSRGITPQGAIAAASNCGEVLLEQESSAIPLKSIRWFSLRG